MSDPRNYDVDASQRHPIKMWTRGVPVEEKAREQLRNVAGLPFIHKHVAVMPDVHFGFGATVGSVIATTGAIVPAAVGVDIGCGMMAVRTNLVAGDLPDSLAGVRSAIERAVPHGRTDDGGPNDRGAWGMREPPEEVTSAWRASSMSTGVLKLTFRRHDSSAAFGSLWNRFNVLCEKHPQLEQANHARHLGTLGTGNHFIEICLDEQDAVWAMLHSGSRGVGGRIGSYFIQLAKKEMERWFVPLPDADLAYLPEGSQYFDDYIEAVGWAQDFARVNRELMMKATLGAMTHELGREVFAYGSTAVNSHHNYVARENHFGKNVFVTRKGAVRARRDELGIIPGSMGARSYIVRGKGNLDSFNSCSHGAGRLMSRGEAKKRFTLEDHAAATAGVECRKDADVVDETPGAYKPIDAVMAAQSDLVEVVHTLKQVICVKG